MRHQPQGRFKEKWKDVQKEAATALQFALQLAIIARIRVFT
jgi:hypothetical protein